uniref:Uncharacterized protein n=1 Tax=Xenopus tropicalis TaxID=8364 RepID=A0A1B8XVJ7_XENTR
MSFSVTISASSLLSIFPLSLAPSEGVKLQLASNVEADPQALDLASRLRFWGISGVRAIRVLYWFFSLFRHREWS